jgi:type I restriction enzyme S subunit
MSESRAILPQVSNWEIATLGEICRSSGGSIQTGPFGSQLHADDYKEDGIPIITVEHLLEGRITHENLPLVGAEDRERLSRYSLVEGDLVFSRVGAIDRCAFVSEAEDGWLFSGRCLRVRTGKRNADSRFLSYNLNSRAQRQWILNHSVGSTMACLNTSILSAIPINLPSGPEQRCIAAILSTIDEAIERTEALIVKYQQIKAGLMHDVFTRGVTPDGHLRPPRSEAPQLYKESLLGWIPLTWNTVPIGDVFDIQLGKMLNKAAKTGGRFSAPYLGNSNVQWDYVDATELETMDFTLAERLKFSLLPEDLLVCEGGDVGRTAMWRGEVDGCFYQKALHRLRPKTPDGIASYMLRFMRFARDHGYFRQFTSRSSIAHLTQEKLASVRMLMPTRGEQVLVAMRFDEADGLLKIEQIRLAKLNQQKQGLMHDLLSGRVRVKIEESAT